MSCDCKFSLDCVENGGNSKLKIEDAELRLNKETDGEAEPRFCHPKSAPVCRSPLMSNGESFSFWLHLTELVSTSFTGPSSARGSEQSMSVESSTRGSVLLLTFLLKAAIMQVPITKEQVQITSKAIAPRVDIFHFSSKFHIASMLYIKYQKN
ncbi:hypothetical protein H5410_038756 [Solanum commersonii]|uniref:Uncharacterized protein n=1 Tax=Solanum commersonii TaxID=4109 RepID=A0A9J5YE32_SOLCO|nr:hypothetical protein H5410_038756 [Solanum commersonii]